MFFGLSKAIAKFGGLNFGIGFRLPKTFILLTLLIMLFVWIFKLVWLAIVFSLWLVYAVFYLLYQCVRGIAQLFVRK